MYDYSVENLFSHSLCSFAHSLSLFVFPWFRAYKVQSWNMVQWLYQWKLHANRRMFVPVLISVIWRDVHWPVYTAYSQVSKLSLKCNRLFPNVLCTPQLYIGSSLDERHASNIGATRRLTNCPWDITQYKERSDQQTPQQSSLVAPRYTRRTCHHWYIPRSQVVTSILTMSLTITAEILRLSSSSLFVSSSTHYPLSTDV